MSEKDDALRELAANRGCRLQKSRRRKQGGDFGRYGLKDAKTGAEIFGFGSKGLTATEEEIRAFLRGNAAAGWKTSLGPGGKPKKLRREPREARRSGKDGTSRESKAIPDLVRQKERKPPKLIVREARARDAEMVAGLVRGLGYEVTADDVRKQLVKAGKREEPTLVAERGELVGCLSWHVTPVLHRPRPVGRITMMVVAEGARGQGIGAALVEAAEKRLRKAGCGLLEVTSNMKRIRAHDFYDGLGFERTSYRFAKAIQTSRR